MINEAVPAALADQRLDRAVALIADVSRSVAASLIERGAVHLDQRPATSGKLRLTEGQVITIDDQAIADDEPPGPDSSIAFDVVYADEYLIVVDKPPGLVVHPGAGNPAGTLVNGLLARFPEIATVGAEQRPGIVHRLDAGSSGLLVVARTQAAAEHLRAQFVAHTATRSYRALVWGHPDAGRAVIDAPVGRSKRNPTRMAVVADGRWARTEYRVLTLYDRPADLSLIECNLETGRTHQIRVHLSSINHPLVGDPTYGQRRPALGLERPFLHAAQLSIDHPGSGRRVSFDSELAPDLSARLASLGRADGGRTDSGTDRR